MRQFRRLSRRELVATLCENLQWKNLAGRPRLEACDQLLDALEVAEGLKLPPKRKSSNKATSEIQGEPIPDVELNVPLSAVRPIRIVPVAKEEQQTWNATMATFHPLGYQRAFGARQHYWIIAEGGSKPLRLGGLLFGSSAKALADRESWIGWTAEERSRFRPRIVNNSRYLILPGVHVPHLASHVLGLVSRRIRSDWQDRYGFAPVLLETFVELPYHGTCYAAANWIRVGETTGRTRQDRHRSIHVPRKSVWLYPLTPNWRKELMAPWPRWEEPDEEEEEEDGGFWE